MTNRVEKMTVVGGGTSGWLSAMILNSYLNKSPDEQPVAVALIESPNVPTIGVGEATIVTLPKEMRQLGIDEKELFRRCNASFKVSVRFGDWVLDGAGRPYSFYHPFNVPAGLGGYIPAYHYHRFGPHWPGMSLAESLLPNPALARAGKAPRLLDGRDYEGLIGYAYHIDAALFAAFLREIALARGIEHIRDDVADVVLGEQGEVSALQLKERGRYPVQFVIDCTGFRNVVMGRLRTQPFISLGDRLLNDRAIPVQIPHRDPTSIESCTRATALGAGWVWRVPLFSRVGTGYVYSSAFRSDDEARAEFFSHLRTIGDLPADAPDPETRVIKMRVGYSEQAWVKNCVTIGLSGGFVEPLEATAIYTIEAAARWLVGHFPDRGCSPVLARRYNQLMTALYEEISDFIHTHYLTSNRVEPYWVAARKDTKVSDSLREKFELWRCRLPEELDTRLNSLFKYWSYIFVLHQKGFFKNIRFPLEGSVRRDHWDVFGRNLEVQKTQMLRALPDHYALLTRLRGAEEGGAGSPGRIFAGMQ